jgi:glycosyltransferase involved in cell wall biosynthesis
LYEGFSLPAIEAMCAGTPLVATDGGALPEVTGRDGETVLQCPAGDVEALAAAIARGLDDPELRARVGAAGRRRVIDRWTWTKCAEQTVEQYREVLAMPANVTKLRRNGRL